MEYLRINPEAADTISGIADWWLVEECDASTDVVDAAVRALVDRGLMERRPTPDGAAIYGRAGAR